MITFEDLPKTYGHPDGQYHLRLRAGHSLSLPGAHFVDGRTQEPLTGSVMSRVVRALGVSLIIEPADAETARSIVQFAVDRRRPDAARQFAEHFAAVLEEAGVRNSERHSDQEPEVGADGEDEGAGGDVIELTDLNKEDILALAELHGIAVDRRWGVGRIAAVLEEAGVSEV